MLNYEIKRGTTTTTTATDGQRRGHAIKRQNDNGTKKETKGFGKPDKCTRFHISRVVTATEKTNHNKPQKTVKGQLRNDMENTWRQLVKQNTTHRETPVVSLHHLVIRESSCENVLSIETEGCCSWGDDGTLTVQQLSRQPFAIQLKYTIHVISSLMKRAALKKDAIVWGRSVYILIS